MPFPSPDSSERRNKPRQGLLWAQGKSRADLDLEGRSPCGWSLTQASEPPGCLSGLLNSPDPHYPGLQVRPGGRPSTGRISHPARAPLAPGRKGVGKLSQAGHPQPGANAQ